MVIEQFPVAGDVAQFVQAPVTGMLPFGGVKNKKEQPCYLFCHFTTMTLYWCVLLHIDSERRFIL